MSKDLRSRAERRIREIDAARPAGASVPASADSQLLHDLHVHQIELEMQNEELRRTEMALEASRARYFDLYDVAPVGYFSISDAGLIVEANLTAATLFGVARGALVNQPVTRFIAAEDQDMYYLHRRRLLATGVPQVLELRLRKADGRQFWGRFEATTAPAADAASEVCRTVVSDISDRKRHEEERLRFERELQQAQKMESLVRMAGAIAHHFNNQLGVVMGNLELSMVTPGENGDHLLEAIRATQRAAAVSGQLLTYLGQSSGDHAPLDLAHACRRSLPMLRAAMPVHVTFHVDLPTPGPAVNGNSAQLQLLLTNLVTNAWEAVGEIQAVVGVRVTTVRGKTIPASRRFAVGWKPRDQDYACIEVTDTGCGIDNQEIEKIFDPFFTSKFTGRGLGLPVVLGILHAHGGGLVVDTRTGHQSRSAFRVYLPVSAEEAVRRAPEPEVDDQSEMQWDGTALVVEDDDALRATTMATMAHLGFTVLGAKNGVEALDVFRANRAAIRLVVCDLTMPHMDGWQTLAALRGLSPSLPVILASGYDEAHVMAGDHDVKPQAFLEKPYPIEALRAAIRRALGKGQT